MFTKASNNSYYLKHYCVNIVSLLNNETENNQVSIFLHFYVFVQPFMDEIFMKMHPQILIYVMNEIDHNIRPIFCSLFSHLVQFP